MLGLRAHLLHQPGALDRLGEARIVLDVGGDHQLAAGLEARQQQRLQHGARGVDRRGVAGRPRADDDDALVRGTVRRSQEGPPSKDCRRAGRDPLQAAVSRPYMGRRDCATTAAATRKRGQFASEISDHACPESRRAVAVRPQGADRRRRARTRRPDRDRRRRHRRSRGFAEERRIPLGKIPALDSRERRRPLRQPRHRRISRLARRRRQDHPRRSRPALPLADAAGAGGRNHGRRRAAALRNALARAGHALRTMDRPSERQDRRARSRPSSARRPRS